MTVTLDTLVARTRRFVRDWPQEDVLTASLASTTSVVSVADGTLYADNWLLEIDQECLFVSANGTGTTFPVRRGQRGSTAASHASTSIVLIRPTFLYQEIVDALNAAKDDMYPLIYKPVLDTSLSTSSNTFEYTVPNMPGTYNGDTIPISYISKIELKTSGETDYHQIRGWSVRRGATPKIQLRFDPEPAATIRVHGFGQFPDLATGSSLDAQWPVSADKLLPLGAASHLLASRESDRATGRGMQDDVGEWSRLQGPGAAISAADRLYQRFQRQLVNSAMSPMPPHVVPTF